MTMRILVDGVEREMSAQEEEAFLAQRAADQAPQVPGSVDSVQFRLALLEAGLLAGATSFIAGMAGAAGEAARIEWPSRPVLRAGALVQALAADLDLTGPQLDALFIRAAQL